MNFEDESYVRLYVRDTKTWLRLGFEGQCVLMFLLRKVDRAGVLDGIEDLCADVALITGVPAELVVIGLPRLLEREVLEHHEDCLVIPNFIEAQTATRTDKARQKDSRDRRLAEARLVTIRDAAVTPCDQTVTAQPVATEPVTPSIDLTKPSLTEPNEDTSPSAPRAPAPVRVVFDHWREALNHPDAKFSVERQRKIRLRLKDYTAEQLCKAIDGCAKSDFHMGRDPNSRGIHDDIELICRDGVHVEKFIAIADGKVPQSRASPKRAGSAQGDHGATGFESKGLVRA